MKLPIIPIIVQVKWMILKSMQPLDTFPPTERDSSINRRCSVMPLRESLCFYCISVTFAEKQQAPFLSPWTCRTCSLLWSCSSTCPAEIAPPPGCTDTVGGVLIWMWRAVSSFLLCFVIGCAPWLACRLYSSVLSVYCLLLFNCPVLQK